MHTPPIPAHHSRLFTAGQRRAVTIAGLALLMTGGPWLAVHYGLGAGAGELPHPAEAWLMRLHGAAAFAALFLLGLVAGVHVPHGWRVSRRGHRRGQRRTGLLLVGLGALAVLSGYLLYYFAPEWLRPTLGWAHALVSSAMALALAWHRRGVRRGAGRQLGPGIASDPDAGLGAEPGPDLRRPRPAKPAALPHPAP